MQVLIVEDEASIADIISRLLVENGYTTDIAKDGEEAWYKLQLQPYDLVILDVLMPKIDGITVCKNIRESRIDTPVLMLTALDAPQDKVKGLDNGADDYLAKPFNLDELLARVRALLRRQAKTKLAPLEIADLKLDPATKSAYRNNSLINLTTKEYALLEYFIRNQDRLISQSELLDHVWDYAYDGLSNVVETYVRYLRKKISPHGESGLIHTKRGSGYIMTTDKLHNV